MKKSLHSNSSLETAFQKAISSGQPYSPFFMHSTWSTLLLSTAFFTACTLCTSCTKQDESKPSPVDSNAKAAMPSAQVKEVASNPKTTSLSLQKESSYSLSYESKESSFYVPDTSEFKRVTYRGDKSNLGTGTGKINIQVDSSGKAKGTLEGPLGPGELSGFLQNGMFTGNFWPKEPGSGFYGTMDGSLSETAKTIHLKTSNANSNLIREAEAK